MSSPSLSLAPTIAPLSLIVDTIADSRDAIILKPASEKPWTEKLWIYDLRTNMHFTLKTNSLRYVDLQDFISCYNPEKRHYRKETDRFKSFTYDELLKRDKTSLDIFWLKDESLEDSENLPPPDVIAKEITENLEAAIQQFAAIQDDLNNK